MAKKKKLMSPQWVEEKKMGFSKCISTLVEDTMEACSTPPDPPPGAADAASTLLLSALFSADPLQTQLQPTTWPLSRTCHPPTKRSDRPAVLPQCQRFHPRAPPLTQLTRYRCLTPQPRGCCRSFRALSVEWTTRTQPITQLLLIALFSLSSDHTNKSAFVARSLRRIFSKCAFATSAGFIRKRQQDA